MVSKKRLADCDDGTPTITRTLDNFAFADGPGWALIDHDTKGMPAAVADRLAELGGPEGALRYLIPGYDDAARVSRASTSSGLSHAETGEQFPGSGGRHDYMLLKDQRDAPRMLKALHKRAWLAGLGWCMVGTAGQLLERSIVDVSVGSPERLVFEGAPVVVAPLVQDTSKRAAIASAATAPLDSRKAVPDLTAAEEAEYRRLVAAERARLKPEAKAEQKKWIAREGAKLGPDGERIVKAALAKRTLSGGVVAPVRRRRAGDRHRRRHHGRSRQVRRRDAGRPDRRDRLRPRQGQAVHQRRRHDRHQQLRPRRQAIPAAALGRQRAGGNREGGRGSRQDLHQGPARGRRERRRGGPASRAGP